MIVFIDDHRGNYGVEAICRVLPVAPSSYYHHQAVKRDPRPKRPFERSAMQISQRRSKPAGKPAASITAR